jgi:hypothetical protein
MKKLFYGLVAMVVFGMSGNAQSNEEVRKVYMENRPVYANLMANFVSNLKPSFTKGMSFKSFAEKNSTINETSADGKIILQKAFTYLQNDTSTRTIQNDENGYEIAVASLNYSKSGKKVPFEEYLFGKSNSKAKGFWGSLWQGIKDVAEWVWDHMEDIINYYVKCCTAKICCK